MQEERASLVEATSAAQQKQAELQASLEEVKIIESARARLESERVRLAAEVYKKKM